MQIKGAIALASGANRGLQRAFAQVLLQAGAEKVYAGARDPSRVTDPGVMSSCTGHHSPKSSHGSGSAMQRCIAAD